MASRTAFNYASGRSHACVGSFDFLKLIVWVAAAMVSWMGIAIIASRLGR
ncbi:MAG: hypothetical protein ACREEL_13510 [Stellaceae bacterium]